MVKDKLLETVAQYSNVSNNNAKDHGALSNDIEKYSDQGITRAPEYWMIHYLNSIQISPITIQKNTMWMPSDIENISLILSSSCRQGKDGQRNQNVKPKCQIVNNNSAWHLKHVIKVSNVNKYRQNKMLKLQDQT